MLGGGLIDPLFKRVVELTQGLLSPMPFHYVVEEHSNAVLRWISRPNA